MRYKFFYLSVALLAFGIGLLFAGNFWVTNDNLILNEENNGTTKTQQEKHVGTGFGTGSSVWRLNKPGSVLKLHKATCSDRKLLPIWNELRKDKEFQERERDFSQKADCSDSIEVDRLDLNGDGQREFIVWGRYNFSSATGNCVIWIYEKKKGKYKQLLQDYAYKNGNAEEWFEVTTDNSKGFQNLLLKVHVSGYETRYNFFEFNGAKYVENKKKCLFEFFGISDKNRSIMTCEEYLARINNN